MRLALVAILAVAVGAGVQQKSAATKVVAPETQLDDKTLWSLDLLATLGNDQPSIDTVAFVNAWQGGEGTDARYNPLATTMDEPGATCFRLNPCVKNYLTRDDGLRASMETITNGLYPNILRGLRTDNVGLALDDKELGTWGTGRGGVQGRLAREREALLLELPDPGVRSAGNLSTGGSRGDLPPGREAAIQRALGEVGKAYVWGAEGPDAFDCSGLVEWVFAQEGRAVTRTTYTQLDQLREVAPEQVEPGDLVYFQFDWDQHVGMLADVDGDGSWDMIHAATPEQGVIVTYNVFSDGLYRNAIIGYRSAF